MKEVVSYQSFNRSMGELLSAMNVSLEVDFTPSERESLRNHLESYIKKIGSNGSDPFSIDMKTLYLRIQGVDEASYLLNLL